MDKAEFVKECEALGVPLPPHALGHFSFYLEFLLEYNAKFNLTKINTPGEVWRKHFLDSLSALLVIKSQGKVVDVGSGAGFPGIPLAIACPSLYVTLVDSLGKRVRFLEEVVVRLGLGGVRVVQARAEDLGRMPEHRERYAYAVTRAVGSLNVLAEYCLPLVERGGIMLAMKGTAAFREVEAAERAVKVLGGGELTTSAWTLPGGGEQRVLVAVKKFRPTPPTYPRRAGLPSKQPL
ncbi:MAG: Ribosomal RNA small subunit methyltransferase G [Firmicutes bacterium]|nr:Ribosomal RNA small subunit methyltransferase G [Bacillota bacterium]